MSNIYLHLLIVLFCASTISSCSDDEVKEPEIDYVEGTIPKNIKVGMVYAISHDKKNDSCTFTIYLGDNPGEDVINEYVGGQIDIYGQDANEGMTFSRKFKSFHVGDTFSIPWVLCERTVMFVIFHSAGDSLIQTEQSWSRVH